MTNHRKRLFQGLAALGIGIAALISSPTSAQAVEPLQCGDVCISSCNEYDASYCSPCNRSTKCVETSGVGPCGTAGALLTCNWDM